MGTNELRTQETQEEKEEASPLTPAIGSGRLSVEMMVGAGAAAGLR